MILEKEIEEILNIDEEALYTIKRTNYEYVDTKKIFNIVSDKILEIHCILFIFFILFLLIQSSNNYFVLIFIMMVYIFSHYTIKSKNKILELLSVAILFPSIYIIYDLNFIQTDYFTIYFILFHILFTMLLFQLLFYNQSKNIVFENIRWYRHAYTSMLLIFLLCSIQFNNYPLLIEDHYFVVLLGQMILFFFIYGYYFEKNWTHAKKIKSIFHFYLYYSVGILIFSSVIKFNINNHFLTLILIAILSIFGLFLLIKSISLFKEFLIIKDAKNIELIFLLYTGIIGIHLLIYSLYSSDIIYILNDQKTLFEMKENVIDYWVNILYFSFASSNSIGYGELHPISWHLKLIVIEEILFSFLMLGVFISKLTNYYIISSKEK